MGNGRATPRTGASEGREYIESTGPDGVFAALREARVRFHVVMRGEPPAPWPTHDNREPKHSIGSFARTMIALAIGFLAVMAACGAASQMFGGAAN